MNISPSLFDFEISLSTLRFGRCAKKIENVIKTNIMAGYNKEALQKIVNTYEKKIAKYKEQVANIKKQQEKMMEFMQGFGVFSEDFMKKMMEQVGDAKGGIKQLMGLWGGRNVDYDRLRRMREDLMESDSEFSDNRVYIDVLAKRPGILYRLNEKLFDDKEADANNQAEKGDGRFNLQNLKRGVDLDRLKMGNLDKTGGGDADSESDEQDLYYYVEINGELKKFEKFVVYDTNGEMVYREDIFDEEGNLQTDLYLFDHFYNKVEVDQLFDSENNCKLKSRRARNRGQKSKQNERQNRGKSNSVYKDRQNMIFKEIRRLIETKWPSEMEAPSLKNEEFLSREVFEKFKEKLDREEILEKTCKVFFEELRTYLKERDAKRDALLGSIWKTQLSTLTALTGGLIQALSDTRHEMEFYERPKRIKHITKEELKEYSNRLRRMLGVYQKEKMRREIVLELRGDNPNLIVNLGDLDEDMIGLGNVKKELAAAEKAKAELEKVLNANVQGLVNWCQKKNFGEVLSVVEAEIGKEVDRIYDDNYNIQSFFYNYSSSVMKNSQILEKKVMFLTEQLVKKFVRREEYMEEGVRLRPFKVWKRRLSVRDLKEKYKRPMFKNMDMLAESDVMFLYKNIQNKLDNFLKVQKDVNRLSTIGNIDDIKNIITSFDQNTEKGKAKNEDSQIYSDQKSVIEEEDEAEEEEAEETEQNGEEQYSEQEEEEEEEEYRPVKKSKRKKKSKKKKVKRNKENDQVNVTDESPYNTIDYDPNLERVYGVKKNNFISKYAPYIGAQKSKSKPVPSSTEKINYVPEDVRRRGYNTFSHKHQTYDNLGENEPDEAFDPNQSDYEDEVYEHSEDHEYEENSQEQMESINDSDASDVSNPYNIDVGNMKMSNQRNMSDEETSIYDEEKPKRYPQPGKDTNLGAYYSGAYQNN